MSSSTVTVREKTIFRKVRKIPPIRKSLSVFIASLQGEQIIVELKNDLKVSGMLEQVDKDMNLVMHNSKLYNIDGLVEEKDIHFINGVSIRYIQFPPEIKPAAQITSYLRKIDKIQSNRRIIKDNKRSSSQMISGGEIDITNEELLMKNENSD